MNKKLKLLTVATSALFAFGGNAWGADVETGGTITLKQPNNLFDVKATPDAAAISVGLDVTDLSGAALSTMVGTFGYGTNGTTSSGVVTINLTGDLAKDATWDGDKLGAIKIAALKINTGGAGYNMFKLDDFQAHVAAGNASMDTSTAAILGVSSGDKNVGFITSGVHADIDQRWFDFGTDPNKKTNLKIEMGTNSKFKNNTANTFDFTYVNELSVKGAQTLSLNNLAADKLPSAIRFIDAATVSGFKDATVLPAVYYSPADKKTTKGGAVGTIEAGASALTINQLGEEKYALAEVKGSTAAAKVLTIGVAKTTAAPDSEKAQYVNKLSYVGGGGTNMVFAGSSLSGVDTASPFAAQTTEIDFAGLAKAVFEVKSENPQLNITVSNATGAGANQTKFVINKGAKFGAGTATDAAIGFGGSLLSLVDGSEVTVPHGTENNIVSPAATAGTTDKPVAVSYSVRPNDKNKAEFAGTLTQFAFTEANQKMTVSAVDKTNIIPVAFTAKDGQEFVVAPKATLKLNATFADKTSNKVTVGEGATLSAAVGHFSIANVVCNAEYTALAAHLVTPANFFASDAQFKAVYDKLKDAKTTLSIAKNATLDTFRGDVTNVEITGDFTMKTSNLCSRDAIDLGANKLYLSGTNYLDSAVGIKGAGASILSGEGAGPNELMLRVNLGESGKELEKVSTGLVSVGDVYVKNFTSDRAAQNLRFGGRGLDSAKSEEKQVVKANISKDKYAYDSAVIGGQGVVTFTGDISDNAVKQLVISAAENQTVTMETGLIEVGDLGFKSTADKGWIKFTKAVEIKSDVKKLAGTTIPVAGGNFALDTAPNIEFADKVTISKKFNDDSATVVAKGLMSVGADVTMKALDVKNLEFTAKSTVTTTSKVTGLNDINIGSNEVTFHNQDVKSAGTFKVAIGANGSSGKLTAKNLDLNAIEIVVADDLALDKGNVINVATVTGSALSYKTTASIDKKFYSGKFEEKGKDLSFVVTAVHDFKDVMKSDAAFVKTVSSDELAMFGSNADAVIAGAKANSNDQVLKELAALQRNATTSEEVRLALPASIVAAKQALDMTGNLVNSRTLEFAAPVVVASGSPADAEGMGLWLEGMYGSGEQKKDVNGTDVSAYKNSLVGFVGGVDYKISDNSLFGAAVGWGSGDLKYEGGTDKAEVSGIVAMVYGAQNFGDAFFSERAGFARFDAERSFKRAGDVKTSSTPVQYFAGVTGGYNIRPNEMLSVAPMFKLSFENGLAFDEKDTGNSKILGTIKNEDKKSLIASGGAKISFNLPAGEEMSITPDLHGFANFDLLASDKDEGSFKFVGQTAAIELKSANAARFSADGGVGLTVKSVLGLEASGKVDLQYRERYLGWMGALKVRVQF